VSKFLNRYGAVSALVVLFIIGACIRADLFIQPENIRNLLNQSVPIGIVAIGMTLVIAAGGIDLSVGSMMAMVGVFALTAMNRAIGGGQPEPMAIWLAFAVAVGMGILSGFINGALVVWGRLAPFIATLAGLVAFRSIGQAQVGSGEVRSMSANAFSAFGNEGIYLSFLRTSRGLQLVLNWSIFLLILVAILFDTILRRTPFGRRLIATGANDAAARYSAISVNWVRLATYALLGACVGLAAFTSASRVNSISSNSAGLYYELDAIAAVVIGGTPLRGGVGRVWGTVVGVLLLAVINNLLIATNVSTDWQGAVKGGIILFAVLIQRGSKE